MSLGKFPITLARLEANRRNPRKSTGPRMARGKSQSRVNGLRSGVRSRLYRDLLQALVDAPPCTVARTAQAVLTPAQAKPPLFAPRMDIFSQSEVALRSRKVLPRQDSQLFLCERSH